VSIPTWENLVQQFLQLAYRQYDLAQPYLSKQIFDRDWQFSRERKERIEIGKEKSRLIIFWEMVKIIGIIFLAVSF